MEQLEFYIQTHWAWSFAVLLLAAGYAYLLYSKEAERKAFGPRLTLLLAFLRFGVAALVLFLLLKPVLKYTSTVTDPARIVFAVDNSTSIPSAVGNEAISQLKAELKASEGVLAEKGITTDIITLTQPQKDPSQLTFTADRTDLSSLLRQVAQQYENQQLNSIVLVSDGLYNQGSSPEYLASRVPVHTVGIGDTIPKQDLAIRSLNYNRISYKGNKFPLQVSISNNGLKGQAARLSVNQGGTELSAKVIAFNSANGLQEHTFILEAKATGQQVLQVRLEALKGEFTLVNNVQEAYLDIIDNKERVVLIASAPHPDIKAIRASLESLGNLDFSVFIPSLGTIPGSNELKPGKPDLVILHQLPDRLSTMQAQLQSWYNEGVPFFHIFGQQTNFSLLRQFQPALNFVPRGQQTDKVSAVFEPAFTRFELATGTTTLLPKLPPIEVPFGVWEVTPGAEVIFNQSLGPVSVGKPLLAISTQNGKKSAVFGGLGLWQWRLQEFAETGNHTVTDGIIQKLVQFLSAKDDKRKLRVEPLQSDLYEQDRVYLKAELYNDLYEQVYNQPVNITVSTQGQRSQTFTLTPTQQNNRLNIGVLKPGVYNYQASATLNGKQEKASGQFTVKELKLEAINTTADFALLRTVAAKSGGTFVKYQDMKQLVASLVASQPSGRIRSFEDLQDAINLRWLLFTVAALAILEWFLRKYFGNY